MTTLSTAADGPEGVSPGGVDRIARTQSTCPTFSWQATPGAAGYEIVVYRIGAAAAELGDDFVLFDDDRVTYLDVPAGVTGWTPDLDECLQTDTSYVWFVRAQWKEPGGEFGPGEWSPGRFFATPAELSSTEVARAVRVLRRYLARGGSPEDLDEFMAVTVADSGTPARQRGVSPRISPEFVAKSVPSAKTAIKGTVGDVVGETYGVVGISASPSGAGLGAANSSGGADLVLDGSTNGAIDTLLSESTLNRPSGGPQTFNVRNSMGGGMTLQVDGVDVITTLTDADTTYAAGYGLTLTGTTFEADVGDFNAVPVVAADDTVIALTTSYQDIHSATITIPGSGYVIAHASAQCDFLNPDPPTNVLAESFSYLCNAADTSSSTNCGTLRLSFALRNAESIAPASQTIAFTNRLPYYSGGGSKTVYWNAKVFSAADTVQCFYRNLVLQYVPD
jgi:hypothetical protein